MNSREANFLDQELSKLQKSKFLELGIWTIIFYLFLFFSLESTSQTVWYKYPGNPVFFPGESGEWDDGLVDQCILLDSNLYRMWYIGRDWSFTYGKIGYATSTDGIEWEKYEGNPLEFSCEGEPWEIAFLGLEVLIKDSVYYMWYTGVHDDSRIWEIGFAWSEDGLNWTTLPEPVIKSGSESEWDGLFVGFAEVCEIEKKYHMWYVGGERKVPAPLKIGYATSVDGIHWKKHRQNPVMDVGKPGSWDDGRLEIGEVIFNGSYFEMWYNGYNYIIFEGGYATSMDGINWSRYSGNPVMKTGGLGAWDTWDVEINNIILRDSSYYTWYAGVTPGFRSVRFGLATTNADEAMTWEEADLKRSHNKILIYPMNRVEFIDTDSLIRAIAEMSGVELINAYNRLALAYALNDNVKSHEYANEALRLSLVEKYSIGEAFANYSLGICNYVMDDYERALANHLIALKLFDSLNLKYEYADLLGQIASIHSYTGSHDLATEYYKKALEEYEELSDTSSILSTLYYLGYSLLEHHDTLEAINVFRRSLSLSKIGDDISKTRSSYVALGKCYLGNIADSSIYYFKRSQEILDTIQSSFVAKGHNLLNIAEAYHSAGPDFFLLAEKYYDSTYGYYMFDGRENRIRLLYDMAELYFNTGRFPQSAEYLDRSESMCRHFLSNLEHQMFLTLKGKLEAEVFLKKYMGKIYWLSYRLDSATNNESDAFIYYMLATKWEDSIYNEQYRRRIAMMQGKYETENTQSQINILRKENEVKDLSIRQSTIVLISMGGFLVLFILIAILLVRQNKIKANQRSVLLEQKLLRLQMNPHFIFNALSNILNLINRNNNETASLYLTRFSKLLRNTLEGSRQDYIQLDAEINGLENYLELQKLRFGDKFEFKIHVDEVIDTESTLIPPLLVQPFIENAIEHGIKHKKAKGHVYLRFLSKENQVFCEIEDDGVGREKAWKLEYSNHKDHQSLATTIIRERIQSLNKNLKGKIMLKIIDLKSEDDVALGTKVVIALPT